METLIGVIVGCICIGLFVIVHYLSPKPHTKYSSPTITTLIEKK